MPRCSYVIAFRSDDVTAGDTGEGPRSSNLSEVIRHVHTIDDLEVIVVEHDSTSNFRATANSARANSASANTQSGVRHVFLPGDGPFNKSWAMNVGFRAATASVIAFGDADLIVETSVLTDAIASVENGFDATKPFDRIVDLDEHQTADVRQRGITVDSSDASSPMRRDAGEHLPFCGGLFITRRELFEKVGGYDERFLGWGGEDDALSVKFARSGARLGIAEDQIAYHLWHGRQLSRYTHSSYQRNLERLQHLQQCSDEELRRIFADDASRMGDPHRPNLDS